MSFYQIEIFGSYQISFLLPKAAYFFCSLAFYRALLYQQMLSQAKQIQRVILVLFFVFSSILAKFSLKSGKSSLNLPSKSPAITTFTLFFVIMSIILSCWQIQDNVCTSFLAKVIKNLTYSSVRLKFSSEKAQKEAQLTPSSRQQSRHFLSVLVPSQWPDKALLF